MKFYALAFQYQEDIYYDFAKQEDTYNLTETCFMPTKQMALSYIEEELGTDYVVVEIDVERVERNGIWSYTRGRVDVWDEVEVD